MSIPFLVIIGIFRKFAALRHDLADTRFTTSSSRKLVCARSVKPSRVCADQREDTDLLSAREYVVHEIHRLAPICGVADACV